MAHHPRSANDFGNPTDLTEYVRKLEGPDRDEWQKPGEVLGALELRRDQVVGEIGAGSGYFTLRLAPAVTHVFAADADVRLVAEDPFLPSGRCDLVLTVNAYHHFPEPPSYLRRVARALRPGGRIAIIDFHEKTKRAQVIRDAKAAGLRVTAEHLFLPQQHFLVFE